MASIKQPFAIIVGAGPSGLLLGLLLAKQNIEVIIFDVAASLDTQPRATHYAPPAVYELRREGVMDDVLKEGFVPGGVCWRKLDGTVLAGLDNVHFKDDPNSMVCLPLHRLGQVLYRHLNQQSSASILWNHKVTGVGQDEEHAWVDVETLEGPKKFEARYVIGCDGASSQVRRSLFGGDFPGKTWDEQIVATNTYFPFEKYGYLDANFIIHPEHWYMAARISTDGLWRVTYGDIPGLSQEELIARQPAKFEAFMPGNPTKDSGAYRIASISPYKVHQRVVDKMRVGRLLLAADAAHLCNPFGGMGLTGGIVDVGGLSDCLIGLYQNKADDSILDKYSEVRIEKYKTLVNPISSSNIVRLFGQDPETALENDEFLKMCLKAEQDPEFSKAMQSGINALMHDFTQYYVR